jgi:hypothetical protein
MTRDAVVLNSVIVESHLIQASISHARPETLLINSRHGLVSFSRHVCEEASDFSCRVSKMEPVCFA